jgi:hypothetical protein
MGTKDKKRIVKLKFNKQRLDLLPDFLANAKETSLFINLVHQINKDLLRANLELQIPITILPKDLVVTLTLFLKDLMLYRYADYLNLMYIVDISENQLKQLDQIATEKIPQETTLLFLKREWQKVYYKNRLS